MKRPPGLWPTQWCQCLTDRMSVSDRSPSVGHWATLCVTSDTLPHESWPAYSVKPTFLFLQVLNTDKITCLITHNNSHTYYLLKKPLKNKLGCICLFSGCACVFVCVCMCVHVCMYGCGYVDPLIWFMKNRFVTVIGLYVCDVFNNTFLNISIACECSLLAGDDLFTGYL